MPDTDIDKAGKGRSGSAQANDASASRGKGPAPTIEEELDRLLAEIEEAVEELDPLGDLEAAAAHAREAALTSDPDYDETEELFEVVIPKVEEPEQEDEAPLTSAETQSPAVEVPVEATVETAAPEVSAVVEPEAEPQSDASLDAELDELLESIEPIAPPVVEEPAPAPKPAPKAQVLGDGGALKADPSAEVNAERSQIDHELDELLASAGKLLEDETDQVEAAVEPAQAESAAGIAEEVEEAEALGEPEPEAGTQTAAPETGDAEVKADEAGADPEISARSIEDIDADLAARADTVVEQGEPEAGSEPATDAADGFESSEDVVEQVIKDQASAVQDGENAAVVNGEPAEEKAGTDDSVANLMAGSPASASVSVDTSESVAPPAPATAPMQPVASHAAASVASASKPAVEPAAPTPPASVDTKIDLIGAGRGTVQSALTRVKPVVLPIARLLSKPLEMLPPKVRDDIGWLSLVTMFLAIAVLTALVLFR